MNPKNFFYPNQYFNKKIGTFEASRDAQNAEFLTICVGSMCVAHLVRFIFITVNNSV
jgi:hypothetical protein